MSVTVTQVEKPRTVTDRYVLVEAGNEGWEYPFSRYDAEAKTFEKLALTADTEYSVRADVKVRHGNQPSTWEKAYVLVFAVNRHHATQVAYDLMTTRFGANGWRSYGRTMRVNELPVSPRDAEFDPTH